MLGTLRLQRSCWSPIGLDLGRGGARVVQLRQVGPRFEVVRAQHVDLNFDPPAPVGAGGADEKLRQTIARHGFRGGAVVAGVGAPDAEIHMLDLPGQAALGSGEQLHQAINIELSRLMSLEPGSAETGSWTLPPSRGGASSAIGVAVAQERVMAVWRLCHDAGLQCRRVDALACACARFGWVARPSQDRKTNEVWGVLDLGRRGTRLILCLGPVPVLVRSFSESGDAWTTAIADSLGISPASAEVHKHDYGIADRQSPRQSTAAPPLVAVGGMILNVLRRDLESLVSHIERSYAYVLQCYPQCTAAGLLLIGGGASLAGLAAFLQERLGIEINRVTDWVGQNGTGRLVDRRGPTAARRPLAEFACAAGLAIPPEADA